MDSYSVPIHHIAGIARLELYRDSRNIRPQQQRDDDRMHQILVIDDDKELCALIKRSVLMENIQADCCHTGAADLVQLRCHAGTLYTYGRAIFPCNQRYLKKRK